MCSISVRGALWCRSNGVLYLLTHTHRPAAFSEGPLQASWLLDKFNPANETKRSGNGPFNRWVFLKFNWFDFILVVFAVFSLKVLVSVRPFYLCCYFKHMTRWTCFWLMEQCTKQKQSDFLIYMFPCFFVTCFVINSPLSLQRHLFRPHLAPGISTAAVWIRRCRVWCVWACTHVVLL